MGVKYVKASFCPGLVSCGMVPECDGTAIDYCYNDGYRTDCERGQEVADKICKLCGSDRAKPVKKGTAGILQLGTVYYPSGKYCYTCKNYLKNWECENITPTDFCQKNLECGDTPRCDGNLISNCMDLGYRRDCSNQDQVADAICKACGYNKQKGFRLGHTSEVQGEIIAYPTGNKITESQRFITQLSCGNPVSQASTTTLLDMGFCSGRLECGTTPKCDGKLIDYCIKDEKGSTCNRFEDVADALCRLCGYKGYETYYVAANAKEYGGTVRYSDEHFCTSC